MTPSRAAALALVLALAGCANDADPVAVDPAASATPTATLSRFATPSPLPTLPPSAAPLATDLADGRHYAYVKEIDRKTRTLTVDVAQFLTGAAAEQAAREDGKEAFDYYVRNQNPKLRELTFTAGMKVVVNTLAASESGSSSKDVPITHAKLASYLAKGEAQQRLFWFTLDGGAIVRLQEQYLP